jgi:tetratricopeptide (TPR) repeat protein
MHTGTTKQVSRSWLWLTAGSVLLLLLAMLMPSSKTEPTTNPGPLASVTPSAGSGRVASDGWTITGHARKAPTAEEIVAAKLKKFGVKRLALVHRLAEHYKIEVLPDVERFFAALDAGDFDETERLFKSLQQNLDSPGSDLRKYWRAIVEADGAAEQAHLWPPQEFLDYGNGVLDSLKPGMAYIGGTDAGCFIVTMLNETSEGEPHLTLTQNALADTGYTAYLTAIYGDSLNVPTDEEEQAAFNQYLDDATRRLQHDQQFPDEPKQLLPGEDVSIVDGRTTLSGQVAVMSINNLLTQVLLQKNPDLSFGLEESFPMSSTYPGAAPLGPIFALNTGNTMTADQASQSVNYWQNEAQQLQAGGETSAPVLQSFSHDANAQGNLLANNNFPDEAGQAYQTALNIYPGSVEAITGLTRVLSQQGQFDQAGQALDNFLQANPQEGQTVSNLRQTWLAGH